MPLCSLQKNNHSIAAQAAIRGQVCQNETSNTPTPGLSQQTGSMTYRITLIALAASCLLAGCKSVEGTWYPGCPAYEGDRVNFEGGNVVWDRYTDQVSLDSGGKVIDPFPGYPLRGTYTVDGSTVVMTFDDATPARTMHTLMHADKLRLLTASQFQEFSRSGTVEDCVLTLDTD